MIRNPEWYEVWTWRWWLIAWRIVLLVPIFLVAGLLYLLAFAGHGPKRAKEMWDTL